ncbi:MAG: sulfate adenylyltransferase subunit CysD [Gammaproteobacteria bacterium]|nr:sulfate adenylyltransferase subunit CysD [Gammaproteobacteria bacterium]
MTFVATAENLPSSAEFHLTHLQQLEAESIYIFREVVAEFDNPVLLYSIGKDSSVLLHLAKKAFYPGKIPFPLLHVDTTWKFREMIQFRDRIAKEYGLDLKVYTNEEYRHEVTPFTHDSKTYTDIMKTEALKQALELYEFDAAFGGARRDEERSRAKERIFSVRDSKHQWDPKNQRPELWQLFNSNIRSNEEVRIFPLSNWTELDIWHYIHQQNIDIVPLYFSKPRPVVKRNNTWIMVDDDRMELETGETPTNKEVRFRTLGCYPLSGAIESTASTVPEIIQEILQTGYSERQGRLIDHGTTAAMEKMRKEGYF